MLGYIFVFLTVFLDTLKGGCSKKLSSTLECLAENINLCFVRNLVCVVFGFLLLLLSGADFNMPLAGWIISFFYGVSMTLNYMTWLMALKTDAYMFANIVSKASFVVVVLFGIFLFDETFSAAKLISFILIIASLYFMMRYQIKLFKKPSAKGIFLLTMVFLSAGINSVCQKAFTVYLPDCSAKLLTLYTFVISCAILLVMRPFFKGVSPAKAQTVKIVKVLPYIVIMGTSLYGATFFQTSANLYVDSVILYPINSALGVLSAGIMSWLFFGEKPSRDSVAGSLLVVVALVLSKF